MSKFNQKVTERKDAMELSTFQLAERTLCTAMLGEDTFYESGESIKDRLESYVSDLTEEESRKLLREAKIDNKLRSSPIFWANLMLKNKQLKAEDAELVTDRVDEITDFLALYWSDKNNKHGLPKQLYKGLLKSFSKFDAYQLSKYRGNDKAVKLRDAVRILHPTPKDDKQSALYKSILDGTLKMDENTWEVAISACGNDLNKKKEAWTKLLGTDDKGRNKLGSLALIRNLRNMKECGVDQDLIYDALSRANMNKILPFQIIGAARFAPEFSDILETKLFESLSEYEALKGETLMLVDVSGSMYYDNISAKSDLRRVDAAAGVASIIKEVCERSTVYKFNEWNELVDKSYHGFAMINKITSGNGGGTALISCAKSALDNYKKEHSGKEPKRIIIITDEADNHYDPYGNGEYLPNLSKSCKGYVINVGNYKNGVNYNKNSWTTISGWSDALVKFITEKEKKGF